MGRSYSRPLQNRVSQRDRAVLKVKSLRDRIKYHQEKISCTVAVEQQMAKLLLLAGKRGKAKCLLRRKYALERQLKTADTHLENLEHIIYQLEFVQVQRMVIEGLRIGNDALRRVHKVLGIKKIEEILKDTMESVHKQIEINALISGLLREEDDSALEAELDKLLQTKSQSEISLQETNVDVQAPEEPLPTTSKQTRIVNCDRPKKKKSKNKEALEVVE